MFIINCFCEKVLEWSNFCEIYTIYHVWSLRKKVFLIFIHNSLKYSYTKTVYCPSLLDFLHIVTLHALRVTWMYWIMLYHYQIFKNNPYWRNKGQSYGRRSFGLGFIFSFLHYFIISGWHQIPFNVYCDIWNLTLDWNYNNMKTCSLDPKV